MERDQKPTYTLSVRDEPSWMYWMDVLTASSGSRKARLCARVGSGPWRKLRVYDDRTDAELGLERLTGWLSELGRVPSWSELRRAARNPMTTGR
jgi:hypothetical protein